MKFQTIVFSVVAFSLVFVSCQNKKGDSRTYTFEEHTGKYPYKTVTHDASGTRIYTLKNGLTVMLSVNREKPRVQTYIAVKAGSKNDPADHTGLAHYLEHLMFKGTDKYGTMDYAREKVYLDAIDSLYEMYNHTTDPVLRKKIYEQIDKTSGKASEFSIANEYDKMVSLIGVQGSNAFTGTEQTVYVADVPSNQLDKWLHLEGERFRKPVFRIFHTELEAVYEEKNRTIDNDFAQFFEVALGALYKKHTYGTQTTIGTIEHLKDPSLLAIKKFYNTYYVPNNMGIVMCGDFDPDKIIESIDRNFGALKPGDVPKFTFEKEDSMQTSKILDVVGPMEEIIGVFYRLPGAVGKDAPMENLLGSVVNRLIDLDLNQKQKTLEGGCYNDVMKDYSTFTLSAKIRSGQSFDEVRDLLVHEVDKVKNGDFEPELLQAIINNYKLDRIKKSEDNEGRANDMLASLVLDRPWTDVAGELDYIGSITKDQVMEYAKRYLTNYICVNKKNGELPSREKVEKPKITPVKTNPDSSSAFVKEFKAIEVPKIEPVFVDYTKDISSASLNNNVPLKYIQNKSNELFSVYYVFDMGKFTDKKLPFAFNYLNYAGTDSLTAEQLNKEFYNLACSYGISASNEKSYVYLSGLQENFDKAMKLFEYFMSHVKPDQEALNKMIEGELKNRADNKLDKGHIRSALLSYAAYGSKNPVNDVLDSQALVSLKAEELCQLVKGLKDYKHRVFYYGPLALNEAAGKMNSYHITQATLKDVPEMQHYTRTPSKETKVYFVNYDMVQAEVMWQNNNMGYDPANAPAIKLFNEYFGGGMGSLVFQTIRESKALAYSTYAYFNTPTRKDDQYNVVAYVGTQADKFDEALIAMNDLLHDMKPVEQLLNTSKEAILKNIETSRTTKADIFFAYENAQQMGLSEDINKRIYERVPGMTTTDLMAFYNTFIKENTYSYCVLASKQRVPVNKLQKLGPVQQISLTEVFGY